MAGAARTWAAGRTAWPARTSRPAGAGGPSETTAGLACGWLNWGFYDHPQARDVSQLTGLLTATGQPKAWAREFQRLGERFRAEPIRPREPGPRPNLDWDRCLIDLEAGRRFREEYLQAFRSDWEHCDPDKRP